MWFLLHGLMSKYFPLLTVSPKKISHESHDLPKKQLLTGLSSKHTGQVIFLLEFFKTEYDLSLQLRKLDIGRVILA